jgi:glycosyltransferase involved in cell wall biosynthesis
MRFSVDAHAIGRHLTGNEVYVRNLLNGFAALDDTSEFIAYVSRDVNHVQTAVPARFAQRYVSRNAFVRLGLDLTRRVRADAPDLLHVQYTAPLVCPCPIVVCVHDVSYLEHPAYFTRARAWQLKTTVQRTVARALRIITPSEFSRRAVERAYPEAAERVRPIPNGVSEIFRPIARESAARQVRQRFGITSPFVLTVGDLQPRKNHLGLIRAFDELMSASPQLRHELVIVGKSTWFAGQVREAARRARCSSRIRFTGFVEDEELLQLYGACDMMAFPSFYEGFGLPILEGMACGRAVACSNTSAMPEVANAAGLLFDPHSVDSMARALRDILLDAELRGRLERLGVQRASHFSWAATARRTLDIYYEVASRGRQQSGRTVQESAAGRV